ncbi:Na+-transporting NADH:ubiquinone oxidoreductase subunit B [Devosia enhydra]|uniref:Na+-transporting NADH:ubiquinone oxidoreductase subunit B n=1 Tax=Devosia enhydra TaxID=665118 RepID=A0A1K2HSH3_9HYPH|nr:RnfABCDGE type electron transport complex subunit D [Devosia enhydra]SFZ80846.1 Na+-transporting NADH:ubiquinone oxidoreductase subunit B [Devosia enhydra]
MIGSRLVQILLHPLLRGQLAVLAALLLPFLYRLASEGTAIIGHCTVLGAVALVWQVAFARARGQRFGLEGLAMALLIALLVPAATPIWHLVLGGTFGIVIGLLVFGGHGRNILHPGVVALAFLMFSFPTEGYRAGIALPLWTLAPALLLLVGSGHANWRILPGAVGMVMGLGWLWNQEALVALPADGLFWLVLLVLVADPVASAATNWGRIGYGLLFGLLVALFLGAGPALGALVFATLMAAIFAPLIDQLVVALNAARRARRHG